MTVGVSSSGVGVATDGGPTVAPQSVEKQKNIFPIRENDDRESQFHKANFTIHQGNQGKNRLCVEDELLVGEHKRIASGRGFCALSTWDQECQRSAASAASAENSFPDENIAPGVSVTRAEQLDVTIPNNYNLNLLLDARNPFSSFESKVEAREVWRVASREEEITSSHGRITRKPTPSSACRESRSRTRSRSPKKAIARDTVEDFLRNIEGKHSIPMSKDRAYLLELSFSGE